MKLTCSCCKEEVFVEPFFYNSQILTIRNPFTEYENLYEARTCVKFICPICGVTNDHRVSKDITDKDIIKLAMGE